MNKNGQLRIDAVQMMQSIRDALDKRISDMTFEEDQAYIHERLRDESTTPCSDSEAPPGVDRVMGCQGDRQHRRAHRNAPLAGHRPHERSAHSCGYVYDGVGQQGEHQRQRAPDSHDAWSVENCLTRLAVRAVNPWSG